MSEISFNSIKESLSVKEIKKFLSSRLGIEIIVGACLGIIMASMLIALIKAKRELNSTKQKVITSENEMNELKQKVNSLEKDLKGQQSIIQENEGLKKEKKVFEERNQDLQVKLKAKESELNQTEKQLSEKETQFNQEKYKLEDRIKKRESELNQAIQELETKEAELNQKIQEFKNSQVETLKINEIISSFELNKNESQALSQSDQELEKFFQGVKDLLSEDNIKNLNIESLNLQEIINFLKDKREKLKSEITNLFTKANINIHEMDLSKENWIGQNLTDKNNWNEIFKNKIKELSGAKEELKQESEKINEFQLQLQILQGAAEEIIKKDEEINALIKEIDEKVFPLINTSWNKENIIEGRSVVSKIGVIKDIYKIQETLKNFLSDQNKGKTTDLLNIIEKLNEIIIKYGDVLDINFNNSSVDFSRSYEKQKTKKKKKNG